MRRESFIGSLTAVAAACVTSAVLGACGGDGSGFGSGGPGSGSEPGSSGSPGSFGGPDAALVSCAQAGQTQSCWTGDPSQRGVGACHDGTQTCVAQTSGEITSLWWGPCTGEQTHCGAGSGGGGSEDGGVGSGGGGGEDGGGSGNGGGGGEPVDAGPPPSCSGPVNTEPDILAAYEPAAGATVSSGGQIKVWVTDECAPTVAPGTQVDTTTGAIAVAGNVTALAPDGYPWEPMLYIGGAAHIPSFIKGSFMPAPPPADRSNCFGGGSAVSGPPIDACPSCQTIPFFFTAEYIWSVSALGLPSGTYDAEFVIHDGDRDRALGCVTIGIQ